MGDTALQVIQGIRGELGDDYGAEWTDFKIYQQMVAAYENAWPEFFVPVADETTYAGSTNNIVPAGTTEIAVPAAFLTSTAQNQTTPNGEVWAMFSRDWDGSTTTTPVPAEWSEVHTGVRMDNLNYGTPKIRFNDWWAVYPSELKLYGGVPLAPPAYGLCKALSGTNAFTQLQGAFMGVNPTAGAVIVFGVAPGDPSVAAGTGWPAGLSKSIRYTTAGGWPGTISDDLGNAVTITTSGIAYYAVVAQVGSTLPGTNVAGFTKWLKAQTRAYLHRANIKASGLDRKANLQRSAMAQQEADQLKADYAMDKQWYTDYNRYGPG